jgi:hypothetical protein
MNRNSLKVALAEAVEYFDSRGFHQWAEEAEKSIDCIEKNDFSFIDSLMFRYAPTCEVEELFITEYTLEQEEIVNKINSELADVVNSVYGALERTRGQVS